jgi:hypothetical protein
MRSADGIVTRGIRAGLSPVDEMLGGGITTLRCADSRWLFELACGILVRNHEPGRKALYLHWADYHKRFWTLDYDFITRQARRHGADLRTFSLDTYFVRAFSRDNNEVEENWRRLFSFARFDLIILDSVSELYVEKGEGSLPMTYSIGRFVQLCIRNDCPGVVLDYSKRLHPYLAHVSSAIIEFEAGPREVSASLIKHPCMADTRISFPRDRQYSLWRWL